MATENAFGHERRHCQCRHLAGKPNEADDQLDFGAKRTLSAPYIEEDEEDEEEADGSGEGRGGGRERGREGGGIQLL